MSICAFPPALPDLRPAQQLDSPAEQVNSIQGCRTARAAARGQLAEGYEGNERLAADEPGCWRPGELVAVQLGGDVGIEDDRVHDGCSGQIAIAFGVGESEEVF
jgi:hypothetical protein